MTENSTEFILLGSGNASGVPAIGNDWGACDPNEPRNRRTRAAGVIKTRQSNILIDFGMDISHQLTRENISQIDAILLTHEHGDHVNGIDDLRTLAFRNKSPIPIYSLAEANEKLEERFPYAFGHLNKHLYQAFIETRELEMKKQTLRGVNFIPFLQDHGTCNTLGFRFGKMAYSTDMRTIDKDNLALLKGVETWIVDGAAYWNEHNPVHANFQTVFKMNETVGARKVYFTHLPRSMDYQTLREELPDGYEPAYDGLKIQL